MYCTFDPNQGRGNYSAVCMLLFAVPSFAVLPRALEFIWGNWACSFAVSQASDLALTLNCPACQILHTKPNFLFQFKKGSPKKFSMSVAMTRVYTLGNIPKTCEKEFGQWSVNSWVCSHKRTLNLMCGYWIISNVNDAKI